MVETEDSMEGLPEVGQEERFFSCWDIQTKRD